MGVSQNTAFKRPAQKDLENPAPLGLSTDALVLEGKVRDDTLLLKAHPEQSLKAPGLPCTFVGPSYYSFLFASFLLFKKAWSDKASGLSKTISEVLGHSQLSERRPAKLLYGSFRPAIFRVSLEGRFWKNTIL
jgi:hypothetical protein